jgi:hypothetical protein
VGDAGATAESDGCSDAVWAGVGEGFVGGFVAGRAVGLAVGLAVGRGVGLGVGTGVGLGVGTGVGLGVGLGVGDGVGGGVGAVTLTVPPGRSILQLPGFPLPSLARAIKEYAWFPAGRAIVAWYTQEPGTNDEPGGIAAVVPSTITPIE